MRPERQITWQECLKGNRVQLVHEINTLDSLLWDYVINCGLADEITVHYIQQKHVTSRDQNRALLHLVSTWDKYQLFTNCLRETSHDHLADILSQAVANIACPLSPSAPPESLLGRGELKGAYVKIMEVTNSRSGGRLNLFRENLQKVLLRDDVKDTQVALLAIAGNGRTGKSFLFNFLLRYLAALEDGSEFEWLDDTERRLVGFPWTEGTGKGTEGILLWDRPFVIPNAEGEKIAVLVMDTQGRLDKSTTRQDENTVVTISTLVSSVLTYNVKSLLSEDVLDSLQIFVDASRTALEEIACDTSDTGLQRLVFVVRDWIARKEHRFGAEGGQNYLSSVLKTDSSQPAEAQVSRQTLMQAFHPLDCYLMPSGPQKDEDDEEMEEPPEFKGKISEMKTCFVKHLDKAVQFLVGRDIPVKKLGSKPATGRDLLRHFVECTAMFKDGKIPTVLTRQNFLDNHNRQVVREIMETFYNALIELQVQGSQVSRELETHSAHALETFERRAKGTDVDKAPHLCVLLKSLDKGKSRVQSTYTAMQEKENENILVKVILTQVEDIYRHRMTMITNLGQPFLTEEQLTNQHEESRTESIDALKRCLADMPTMGCIQFYQTKLQTSLDHELERYKERNLQNQTGADLSYEHVRENLNHSETGAERKYFVLLWERFTEFLKKLHKTLNNQPITGDPVDMAEEVEVNIGEVQVEA